MKRVIIMNEQMELVRNKLEKLIAVTGSLVDNEVVSLSQELDKLIFQYYLCEN
ncbi:MAG: aspartyl-phosphate phosphatase Spo0E family protein [Clostridium sp.]|uniref:aspartyl-phosphate phosphatase Spo0E family protein n=1 Tax=Clostridium sp. TaxID=1506 RepID=UPI003D6D19F3